MEKCIFKKRNLLIKIHCYENKKTGFRSGDNIFTSPICSGILCGIYVLKLNNKKRYNNNKHHKNEQGFKQTFQQK